MVKLAYHGHSCVEIESGGHRIIIDPFINGNTHAKVKPSDIRVEAVLVTHGHGDHVGDAAEIAAANDCAVVCNFEISNWLGAKGVKTHPMHIGGSHGFDWGRVKLTPALHGSSLPDGSYGGNPAGFLVFMGGKCVYHAGDTGITSDMQLYGRLNPIDIALLPIGDNFTMDLNDAVEAAVLLGAKQAMPIHFDTFPIIAANPQEFIRKVEARGIRGRICMPGETLEV
ncbi:MAG TPA: metal-dependent hydrolase [Acidobacteriota bacterium]|nr:metal-dependent hydrolase [Acidobacteriota bacterium]HNT18730.1 metal-dependent hydrolase [Acidobacteriota bacterium]HPA27798.1 metal-dependent hydrolase [Acidobacteriota bacterium]HQO21075.1 metal-dependent hydrolase [Acidobacteriota bacterium]HQQ47873.1 metal-dependent hydrolase [Acidobacteriota bacterium]